MNDKLQQIQITQWLTTDYYKCTMYNAARACI